MGVDKKGRGSKTVRHTYGSDVRRVQNISNFVGPRSIRVLLGTNGPFFPQAVSSHRKLGSC